MFKNHPKYPMVDSNEGPCVLRLRCLNKNWRLMSFWAYEILWNFLWSFLGLKFVMIFQTFNFLGTWVFVGWQSCKSLTLDSMKAYYLFINTLKVFISTTLLRWTELHKTFTVTGRNFRVVYPHQNSRNPPNTYLHTVLQTTHAACPSDVRVPRPILACRWRPQPLQHEQIESPWNEAGMEMVDPFRKWSPNSWFTGVCWLICRLGVWNESKRTPTYPCSIPQASTKPQMKGWIPS